MHFLLEEDCLKLFRSKLVRHLHSGLVSVLKLVSSLNNAHFNNPIMALYKVSENLMKFNEFNGDAW